MNPKRKQRLYVILGLVAGLGVAVGLVMYALSQNINLFFTPHAIGGWKGARSATDSGGWHGGRRDCGPGPAEFTGRF